MYKDDVDGLFVWVATPGHFNRFVLKLHKFMCGRISPFIVYIVVHQLPQAVRDVVWSLHNAAMTIQGECML